MEGIAACPTLVVCDADLNGEGAVIGVGTGARDGARTCSLVENACFYRAITPIYGGAVGIQDTGVSETGGERYDVARVDGR